MKRPSELAGLLALLAFLALPALVHAQDGPVTARTPREAVSQERAVVTEEFDNLRFSVEDAEQEQYSLLKRAERLLNAAGTRVNGTGRMG